MKPWRAATGYHARSETGQLCMTAHYTSTNESCIGGGAWRLMVDRVMGHLRNVTVYKIRLIFTSQQVRCIQVYRASIKHTLVRTYIIYTAIMGSLCSKPAPSKPSTTASADVVIQTPNGIHDVGLHHIVKESKTYSSNIRITVDGRTVSGISKIEMEGLDLAMGKTMTIWAEGEDADEAVQSLQGLVSSLKDDEPPAKKYDL
ncbi:Phosphocarrier protein HPr [Fulvia fulva]|nr:Phosphocarrier protein HPr [Fulvia fulva]KAK4611158.1 Phosphocarrier protein HPr [Fulvia fulva]WPV22309.1 Phosphocarrier protein HPr [Fulvia fulva]